MYFFVLIIIMKRKKRNYTAIHLWNKQGQYVGNILFTPCVPIMTEEQFVDLVLSYYPHLKGERWTAKFV